MMMIKKSGVVWGIAFGSVRNSEGKASRNGSLILNLGFWISREREREREAFD